ncbi:hypothetical protein P9F83_10005 [Peribacillus psychrosaccharolyticus]|uniref:hypothetical protein n=1 Tax=Peribacillus psychrosaccharolyticus TaxID=1407 RepID=UPI002DB73D62|nr:hypothetical protein [Peribacillus psychrosaccharolyticus]MEC2055561.1 hypothetical protein [Peribacillus psychrosaccharolyticus]
MDRLDIVAEKETCTGPFSIRIMGLKELMGYLKRSLLALRLTDKLNYVNKTVILPSLPLTGQIS